MRRRHWILALAALPLAACTATHAPTTAAPATGRPAPALRLLAFDSCRELLTDLRAAALKSVGPWGLPGGLLVPEATAALAGGARSVVADKAAVPAPAPFSGTNVHELSADEPDIVKTDGRRIVTVDRGELRVVDPATHTQTGKLSLGVEGTAELLLSGDRALVLIHASPWGAYKRVMTPPGVAGGGDTTVLLVDLTGTPRLISRYKSTGSLVDARQTGSVARVVLSNAPRIRFPLSAGSEPALLRQNQRIISTTPVEAWLPSWELTTGTATSHGRLDCSAVSRPTTFSGAGMLDVLTFDLAGTALTDGSPVALVADGDVVYGTGESLYLANNQPWRFTAKPESASPGTEIYKFALPPAGKPIYVAGGTVPGLLLNQYALSEWDGYLRVATTDANGGASAVRVLRDRDGKLVQVGEVGGLGKGERIYSVRFIGDRGYVVTFRQTDPLYSLDLADPARPRVTGELKINGYSAHLQPVGGNRLIGIGQEASDQGVPEGMQISLFDVSDPDHPRRLDQQVVSQSTSEAELDPHAVLWWPANDLLVLPVTAYSGSNDALAVRVSATGLTTAGNLTAPGDSDAPKRRSLVVGDELWTLSDRGLMSSKLSTLDRTGWVPLT